MKNQNLNSFWTYGSIILVLVTLIGIIVFMNRRSVSSELVTRIDIEQAITAVTVSSDGTLMAAAYKNGSISIRHIPNLTEIAQWQRVSEPSYQIAFAPNNQAVLVAQKGAIVTWDLSSQKELYHLRFQSRINSSTPAFIRSLAVHPTLPLAAAGSDTGEVIIFDPNTGQIVQNWRWRTPELCTACSIPIRAIAFSRDGIQFAFGAESGQVILWDIAQQSATHVFYTPAGYAREITFSDDGRSVSVLYQNAKFAQWSIPENRLLFETHIETWDIPSVTFTDSGKEIIYGGPTYKNSFFSGFPIFGPRPDPNIYIRNLQNSDTPHILKGHQSKVTSLSWNEHTRLLISGSENGMVALWSISSQK
jgi:WD40 repeat protein